jgi:cytochrome c oxidase subunit 1
MLYAMSFIWVFSIGGLTGLPLATMSTDVHLHDTYFVVAHFHYVMVGGTVFSFLGGLHHWWPKMFGKMYHEGMAKISWFLIFVGFNLTFFIQFFMGMHGMPRRYWAYLPEYQLEHQISTIGSYMQAVGFLLLAAVFLQSLFGGKRAPKNPWGGTTLEWQADSPPHFENFTEPPVVTDPYAYDSVEWDEAEGGYRRRVGYVPDAAH